MRRFVIGSVLLVGALCHAQPRFDHRGSLGLTVATGAELLTAVSSTSAAERGARLPIELGGTLSLSDRNELRLAARLAPGVAPITVWAGSFYLGIRNSLGREQWKSFFDLDLAVHAWPFFTVGVRAAFGVQYDFLPIMGVYAQIGGQLGGATSLRLSGELMIGLQFRTYLFE